MLTEHQKTIIDFAKKYGFNDKLIKRGVVETEQVPKGQEYFEFEIKHFITNQ